MINLITATNRKGNLSSSFAKVIYQQLEKDKVDFSHFSLEDLPQSIMLDDIYQLGQSPFTDFSAKYIETADQLIFVIPEYNGSFPGILKVFIDAIEPKYFRGKKAALIGVGAGFAGNLRGLEHFTGVLNYLGVTVFPKKLTISRIDSIVQDGEVTDQKTIESIHKLINDFKGF